MTLPPSPSKPDQWLIDAIPLGAENAISARMIWEMGGRVWIIATIKLKLKRLVEAGLIERTTIAVKGRRIDTAVYYRNGEP